MVSHSVLVGCNQFCFYPLCKGSILAVLFAGDDALPGNFGMLDQVEALRWVQTNIHGKYYFHDIGKSAQSP